MPTKMVQVWLTGSAAGTFTLMLVAATLRRSPPGKAEIGVGVLKVTRSTPKKFVPLSVIGTPGAACVGVNWLPEAANFGGGGGGSIVNISSIGAIRPTMTDLPYAAAKAGLNTLTVGFAVTFGPSVRSNGIMVGPFLTDISKAWDVEAFEAHAKRRYPLQRLGRPDEIVGTALYLASDASSFTTGTVITVDGGVSISSPFMSKNG